MSRWASPPGLAWPGLRGNACLPGRAGHQGHCQPPERSGRSLLEGLQHHRQRGALWGEGYTEELGAPGGATSAEQWGLPSRGALCATGTWMGCGGGLGRLGRFPTPSSCPSAFRGQAGRGLQGPSPAQRRYPELPFLQPRRGRKRVCVWEASRHSATRCGCSSPPPPVTALLFSETNQV